MLRQTVDEAIIDVVGIVLLGRVINVNRKAGDIVGVHMVGMAAEVVRETFRECTIQLADGVEMGGRNAGAVDEVGYDGVVVAGIIRGIVKKDIALVIGRIVRVILGWIHNPLGSDPLIEAIEGVVVGKAPKIPEQVLYKVICRVVLSIVRKAAVDVVVVIRRVVRWISHGAINTDVIVREVVEEAIVAVGLDTFECA